MKRVLVILLIVLALSGCGQKESVPSQPEEKVPSVEQTEPPMAEREPVPQPQLEPTPAPEEEPVPEPEVAPLPKPTEKRDYGAIAAAAYADITGHETFYVTVWQENVSRTEITVRQGENDRSVQGLADNFDKFEWSPAGAEEWLAMISTENYGPQLSFYLPGEMSFICYRGSDIVEIVDQTKVTYLRAVNPGREQDPSEENLYGLLDVVAEEAILLQMRTATVDGSLSPGEAAEALAEKVAENFLAMPDWVSWKPLDAKVGSTEVYDIYRGEPQEFCFNRTLRVKFENAEDANSIYWQAGAGLEGLDGDGYYGSFSQIRVCKNTDGDWIVAEGGTGGYRVRPEKPEEQSNVLWLTELFCLTEGQTHDWHVPCELLGLSPEEMATLPDALKQMEERQARELCKTMGDLLRREDLEWNYTADTLKPLLGDYGPWLDA